jgi:NADPH:quinone reductase
MRVAQQVIVNRFGGPEVLEIIEATVPSPGPGQMLVRVEAAGVLYGDIMRRTDHYLIPTALPYEPGTEIAGTVDAIGPGVSTHTPGDRVLCRLASGGYAQYAIVEAAKAIALPDEIPFAEATGLLAQGITAYLLTHQVATLQGQAVFIESAAGGVGMQMVQLAKALGASFIVGSASSFEKRAFARSNGVDLAVNLSDENWSQQVLDATQGQGVNVAYESSGGAFTELLKCLAPFGTLIKFGRGVDEHQVFDPTQVVEKNQTLRGFYLPGYFAPAYAPLIQNATQSLIGSMLRGELNVRIDHRYPLAHVALAHRAIEERKTMGKLVLEPWSA